MARAKAGPPGELSRPGLADGEANLLRDFTVRRRVPFPVSAICVKSGPGRDEAAPKTGSLSSHPEREGLIRHAPRGDP